MTETFNNLTPSLHFSTHTPISLSHNVYYIWFRLFSQFHQSLATHNHPKKKRSRLVWQDLKEGRHTTRSHQNCKSSNKSHKNRNKFESKKIKQWIPSTILWCICVVWMHAWSYFQLYIRLWCPLFFLIYHVTYITLVGILGPVTYSDWCYYSLFSSSFLHI